MEKTKYNFSVLIAVTLSFYLGYAQDSLSFWNLADMPLNELMQVKIVTAGKHPEKMEDIPASVEIITRREIDKFGYSSLREILDNITGYYAMSNLGSDIYGVRGFAGGEGCNFIVLVNNVRIQDNYILKLYQIPVEFIDRIEIIKGPMAVIYGDNAFYGAINIFINKDNKNKVSVSTGSFKYNKIRFSYTEKYKQIAFHTNIGYESFNGADFNLNDMSENLASFNLPDYAYSTKNMLEREQKYLNLSARFNNLSFDLFYVDNLRELYYYMPSVKGGTQFLLSNILLATNYGKDISQKFHLNVKASYSHNFTKSDYHLVSEDFYGWDEIVEKKTGRRN